MSRLDYEYAFADTAVDPFTLSPTTEEALEEYDFLYHQNPNEYKQDLTSRIWSYSFNDGFAIFGNHDDADLNFTKVAENGCSRSEAVLLQSNERGSSAIPKELVFADFLHFAMKQSGIRDSNGDTIPVLSIPLPHSDKHPIAGRSRKTKPLARMALSTLDLCGAESMEGIHLGGAIQGAAVAGETVKLGQRQFDIKSAYLSELPNAVRRTLPGLVKDLATGDKSTRKKWAINDPEAHIAAIKELEDPYRLKEIFKPGNIKANTRMLRDIGRGTFTESLSEFKEGGVALTLEYGSMSKIAQSVDPDLFYQGDMCQLNKRGLVQVLKAEGVGHGHVNNMLQQVDAILRSIKFAKKVSS